MATYTYKDLIEAYIQSQSKRHVHSDFERYHQRLVVALETAFEINLSAQGSQDRVMWVLFDSTVNSYLRIQTPWNDFGDTPTLRERLQIKGSHGEKVLSYSDQIMQVQDENRKLHRHILDELFQMMYGEMRKEVTSEALREHGFDDSEKPKVEDSYQYLS